MNDTQTLVPDDSQQRLLKAKDGCSASLGKLLDEAHHYLRIIAQSSLDTDVQGKLSASDLVQETLANAHEHFMDFQGHDVKQLMAWLRRILVNNILDHYRRLRETQKRNIGRESSISVDYVAIAEDTPSTLAMQNEEQSALAAELSKMPEHYRRVIEMRHRDQLSFTEIAKAINKSPDATRRIWSRAVHQLTTALNH